MLPLTQPDLSTFRLFYAGPVGVSGVGVQQTWDLSILPEAVREDPSFVDNFLIFLRPTGSGISNVDKEPGFVFDAAGIPAEISLTLTSSDTENQIDLLVWYIHSITR